MISGSDLHFHDLVALFVFGAAREAGAQFEGGAAIVRWKPEPMGDAADVNFLKNVEKQNAKRRVGSLKLPVHF